MRLCARYRLHHQINLINSMIKCAKDNSPPLSQASSFVKAKTTLLDLPATNNARVCCCPCPWSIVAVSHAQNATKLQESPTSNFTMRSFIKAPLVVEPYHASWLILNRIHTWLEREMLVLAIHVVNSTVTGQSLSECRYGDCKEAKTIARAMGNSSYLYHLLYIRADTSHF